MSTRKIVFIIGSLSVGGAEKQLALLYEARPDTMKDVDVEIVVFVRAPNTRFLEDKFLDMDVDSILVERGSQALPSFFLNLTRTLRALRPQIVHTLLPGTPGTWGRLAAKAARVPYIFHSDLTLYPQGLTRSHHFMRPLLDRMTVRFFPNAQAIVDSIIAKGVKRDRITLIPCGVDLTRFAPDAAKYKAARVRWNIPEGALVAGFLARFAPVKRPELLLEAVQALPEAERPDYLVFGGEGPLLPVVKEHVQSDCWLRERCRILGFVEDTPEFLAGIDYLVLPSDSEGLPNVLLETMATAKPIIASRVSDVPALIDGVGFLMESGSKESLMQALRDMQCLTSEERALMGQQARVRALENYEIRRVAERFWNAHLEFLSEE